MSIIGRRTDGTTGFLRASTPSARTSTGLALKFEEGYTPQMVVDGSVQFVGNDPQKALTSITEAAQSPKVALSLSAPVVDGKRIGCSVSAASSSPLPKADLYAAVVEPTASTEVKRGENNGRHLDHVGVVLSLQRIGKLQDLGSGPLKFNLKTPPDVSLRRACGSSSLHRALGRGRSVGLHPSPPPNIVATNNSCSGRGILPAAGASRIEVDGRSGKT